MELSKRMLEFANEPVHVDAEASKEEAIAIVDAIWKDVVLLEWQPEVAQLEAESERLRNDLVNWIERKTGYGRYRSDVR